MLSSPPWRLVAALVLQLLVLLGVAAQEFRLFEWGFFVLQEWRHASEWRERSIWLPDYQVDIEARPIGSLSLLRGQHGLQGAVPQAEGVAMDNDGNLYMVSESNLFYVFRKQARD